MSQSDISWPMVHRIEDAASKFGHEADRIEAAAQRMAAMFEDGYGGNAPRLIELLESARSSDAAQQRDEPLAAPEKMNRAYVGLMENGRDRIIALGGDCDPVDVMERSDPHLRESRAAIARAKGGAA